MQQFSDLFTNIRMQDVIDIVLLTAVIYWLLQLIKGTRTIPILVGLSVLLATYILASYLELDAIGWVMDNLFSSAVVILVVLFQADIRTALARVGMTTMFREISSSAQLSMIDEVVHAAFNMARRRVGASIVLANEMGLRNYIDRGKLIMAQPSGELLESIFITASPLHDGAVIINREGQLAAARCILPLTMNPVSSAFLGTRHRSAIGLTEETDAVVIVVSEERGQVSLAHRGRLLRDLNETELRRRITLILQGGTSRDDAITEVSQQTQTA